MKTQLLIAACTASLFIAVVDTTSASDLSFAATTLKSARHMYTPSAARQTTKPVAPATVEPVAPKLLLGAYLKDVPGGLQVVRTVPGSPASKVLQAGDIIRRVTALGVQPRTIATMLQFDYVKQEIGPNRVAALEIFRQGEGHRYVTVTFQTANRLAIVSGDTRNRTARSMFEHNNVSFGR